MTEAAGVSGGTLGSARGIGGGSEDKSGGFANVLSVFPNFQIKLLGGEGVAGIADIADS